MPSLGRVTIDGQRLYPGENASPQLMLALAREYRQAAEALIATGRRKGPLSCAPSRFVAIHAVELHLNAALLASGQRPSALRGMRHDLALRVELAAAVGLRLRRRTLEHLLTLSSTREYLSMRYDPEASASSPLNRLSATLTEVAEKACRLVDGMGAACGGAQAIACQQTSAQGAPRPAE